jgi:hypothetical protein
MEINTNEVNIGNILKKGMDNEGIAKYEVRHQGEVLLTS